MKIIDEKEKTIPFSALSCGDVCKIMWADGSGPTYAIKISAIEADCGCSVYNAIDLEDGEAFECAPSQAVIPLDAELRIL